MSDIFTSRRGFLGAAAGVAGFLLRPFAASSQTQTPTATPGPAVATPTPVPADPVTSALAKLARERYGKFLSAEELPMLDERIAALERRGVRLRAVKLANGEEPAAQFHAGRP
ncbi:MAG: hypothetical protein M3R62_00215 [Acidobacteriota bacterium]|nr:hypothetical protein [Acidobacteriota bacterium]